MGILSKLFGSDKVVGGVVDGIYNGVDKLVYTEEEKSDNFARILKLYEPFKIAQRLLALIFGIPYAIGWMATFVASFYVEDVDAQLELLGGDMGNIVLAIVGFYFLGGAMTGALKSKGK